jgi:hypothetical protein
MKTRVADLKLIATDKLKNGQSSECILDTVYEVSEDVADLFREVRKPCQK